MNIRASLLLTAALVAINGCGGGGSDDSVAGPCVVVPLEPVVQITSAIDAVNRQPLEQVSLTNFRVNGVAVEPAVITTPSTGVTLVGNSLRCTLPCGFGSHFAATYSFTVEASGHVATPISVDARYTSVTGGCPGEARGGTKISIALSPG